VLTTVGYGDFTGGERAEYLYTMGLEFLGITFFATLTAILTSLVTTGGNYDSMVAEKQEETNIWIMKLQKARDSSGKVFMPARMYRDVSQFIDDAFKYDFNLLVEDYNFYQLLPPKS